MFYCPLEGKAATIQLHSETHNPGVGKDLRSHLVQPPVEEPHKHLCYSIKKVVGFLLLLCQANKCVKHSLLWGRWSWEDTIPFCQDSFHYTASKATWVCLCSGAKYRRVSLQVCVCGWRLITGMCTNHKILSETQFNTSDWVLWFG